MQKIIMFYGPAGVGKTTQAKLLAEKLGRKWLSAGEIIRNSQQFGEFTAKGAMIDEDILVKLLSDAFNEAEKEGVDVVFDGQPGSMEQVKMLNDAGVLEKVEKIIYLSAPREVLIERLSGRGREDDNIDVWNRKIDYFEQKIYSFLTDMKRYNIPVFEVDASGNIEEIQDRINQI